MKYSLSRSPALVLQILLSHFVFSRHRTNTGIMLSLVERENLNVARTRLISVFLLEYQIYVRLQPIRTPGAVQAFGVLIVVEESEDALVVRQVSDVCFFPIQYN